MAVLVSRQLLKRTVGAVRIEEKCGVWRIESATPSDFDDVEKEASNLNLILLTPNRPITSRVQDDAFESPRFARMRVS